MEATTYAYAKVTHKEEADYKDLEARHYRYAAKIAKNDKTVTAHYLAKALINKFGVCTVSLPILFGLTKPKRKSTRKVK